MQVQVTPVTSVLMQCYAESSFNFLFLCRYKGYSDGRSTVEHLCGGTIVGPTFVITATHCFLSSRRDRIINNVQSFRVLVGGHVKESKSDGAK